MRRVKEKGYETMNKYYDSFYAILRKSSWYLDIYEYDEFGDDIKNIELLIETHESLKKHLKERINKCNEILNNNPNSRVELMWSTTKGDLQNVLDYLEKGEQK